VLLSSIKRGQINFTENNGTLLPGYLAKPDFFGRGVINGASFGPTTGFLLGSQTDIRNQAIQNGWITSSDLLNDPFTTTKNQQLTGTLQIEPHKSFRIDLNFNRSLQQTTSQFQYNLNNPIRPFENTTETYSISTVNLSTSFTDSEQIYQNLLTNARAISSRLGSNFVDVNNDGYNDGYGIANADVLIPAFESAISGRNANSSSLDYKREIPLPNWKITYTGLMNVPWIAKRFQKVDFTHSYISTYSVGGVQSNLNYYNAQLPNTQPDITNPDPLNHLKDKNGNFYTKNTFGSVVVLEGFNPLIGVDLTLRNSMQLRFQYNKDRLTSLSMSNFTINEELGSEFIFGLGYILKDIQLNMKFRGNPTTIKSDLNIRADISIRDTKTNLRRIVEDDSQITGGQNLVSVRFASDYNFSKNINVKLFYDQNITKYKISTAFPLSTIRAGLTATFRFGN